jgi:ribosomal protein S18 acetylase RimI-like enzyme
MANFSVRPLAAEDRKWVKQFIAMQWGVEIIVVHGAVFRPEHLDGFVATSGEEFVGLITYHIQGGECEVVTLDSLDPNCGIGSALMEAVKLRARQSGCRRLWLITTNDNLNALRFYQKRGYALAALHRNALEQSRKIKPEIPLVGNDGIPLRDEIELEMMLEGED